MLGPADIHIHRKPFAREFRIPRLRLIIAGRIAQEVPGGVQEVTADVGLTPGRSSTDRAGGIHKALDCRQGRGPRTGSHPILYILPQHRQLIFKHRYYTMLMTVDNSDGRTPVALPAN